MDWLSLIIHSSFFIVFEVVFSVYCNFHVVIHSPSLSLRTVSIRLRMRMRKLNYKTFS